jgi:hypothetical protein
MMIAPSRIGESCRAVALVIFLSVLFVVLAAVHLMLFRPAIRRLRVLKVDGRTFRERWRELDPARRREISRTIRRGQPVTDPQDAQLAPEAIRNGERVAEAVRPLQLLYAPALVGFFVYALVERNRFLIVFGAAIVGSMVLARLFVWQRTRKLRAAAAATRARGAAR